MTKITFHQSVSIDGFSAGADPTVEQPLGIGGESLHEWVIGLDSWREPHGLEGGERTASSKVVEETTVNVGAYVMGRNMFGGGTGPWVDHSWQGWWGENPPFHAPVFVLTHFPRPPIHLDGGTTFQFVTTGPEVALERAREAAGDGDIAIAGGAMTIQQYLRLGVVDEFWLDITPVCLGQGVRLLEDVSNLRVHQEKAVEGKGVTHVKYEVVKSSSKSS